MNKDGFNSLRQQCGALIQSHDESYVCSALRKSSKVIVLSNKSFEDVSNDGFSMERTERRRLAS